MAFKLTKEQKTEKTQLLEKYEQAKDELEQAVIDVNNTIAEAVNDAELARKKLNDVIEEMNTFMDQVGTDLRSEYDDKPEVWQEGEKGSSVDEFIDRWENSAIETIDEFEEVKLEEPCLDEDPFSELGDEFEG